MFTLLVHFNISVMSTNITRPYHVRESLLLSQVVHWFIIDVWEYGPKYGVSVKLLVKTVQPPLLEYFKDNKVKYMVGAQMVSL